MPESQAIEGDQFIVCGVNVWTFTPRTAPAVHNDVSGARQILDPLPNDAECPSRSEAGPIYSGCGTCASR